VSDSKVPEVLHSFSTACPCPFFILYIYIYIRFFRYMYIYIYIYIQIYTYIYIYVYVYVYIDFIAIRGWVHGTSHRSAALVLREHYDMAWLNSEGLTHYDMAKRSTKVLAQQFGEFYKNANWSERKQPPWPLPAKRAKINAVPRQKHNVARELRASEWRSSGGGASSGGAA
jgi:hypothetical protein